MLRSLQLQSFLILTPSFWYSRWDFDTGDFGKVRGLMRGMASESILRSPNLCHSSLIPMPWHMLFPHLSHRSPFFPGCGSRDRAQISPVLWIKAELSLAAGSSELQVPCSAFWPHPAHRSGQATPHWVYLCDSCDANTRHRFWMSFPAPSHHFLR